MCEYMYMGTCEEVRGECKEVGSVFQAYQKDPTLLVSLDICTHVHIPPPLII